MLNELLLLSGNDIPFLSGQLIIHQPTVKEIAYIGEETFYIGCDFLKFSKEQLPDKDKDSLEGVSNFDIIMSIIMSNNMDSKKNAVAAQMVLSLLFPTYRIDYSKRQIDFNRTVEEGIAERGFLNNDNYKDFIHILDEIFVLTFNKENNTNYEPSGSLAAKIADKFNQRHQKLAELKNGGHQKVAILSRYISILAVGQQRDINSYMSYTVYQLFDEFTRYELKINYDVYLQAKLAGASDLKEVDDWMKDIHP